MEINGVTKIELQTMTAICQMAGTLDEISKTLKENWQKTNDVPEQFKVMFQAFVKEFYVQTEPDDACMNALIKSGCDETMAKELGVDWAFAIAHEFEGKNANAVRNLSGDRKQYADKDTGIAQERYKDLCEYFGNDEDAIKSILEDKAEFQKWLERMRWHVKECDRLARKLEALEKNAKRSETESSPVIPAAVIKCNEAKPGDIVACGGTRARIEKIISQYTDPVYSEDGTLVKEYLSVEFTDNTGRYHYWKQRTDGGRLIRKAENKESA